MKEKGNEFNDVLQDAISHFEKLYSIQKWYNFLNKKRILKAINHLKQQQNANT